MIALSRLTLPRSRLRPFTIRYIMEEGQSSLVAFIQKGYGGNLYIKGSPIE
jgi:hypothetical protein